MVDLSFFRLHNLTRASWRSVRGVSNLLKSTASESALLRERARRRTASWRYLSGPPDESTKHSSRNQLTTLFARLNNFTPHSRAFLTNTLRAAAHLLARPALMSRAEAATKFTTTLTSTSTEYAAESHAISNFVLNAIASITRASCARSWHRRRLHGIPMPTSPLPARVSHWRASRD